MLTLLLLALQAGPWEPLPLPPAAAGKTLRSVAAAAARTAWIVGEQGLCLRSTDAGKTWTTGPRETTATLRSVRFVNEKTGFIVGDGDAGAPKATGHNVMG